jgi:hypothetical protein
MLCGMLVVHWPSLDAPDALRAIGSSVDWPGFLIWRLGAVPASAKIREGDSHFGAQDGPSNDISLQEGDVGVACRRDTQSGDRFWIEFAFALTAVAKAVVGTSGDLRKNSFGRS